MIRYLIPALLLLAAMGCSAPPRHEGGPGGPPPGSPPAMDSAQRLDRTMQDLIKRLELSTDQAQKVRAIIKAGEEKKEKMRPEGDRYDSPTEMEKFFARLRQVDKETEQALSKVLTESQLKEYKKYLKERRRGLIEHKDQGGGPPEGRRRPWRQSLQWKRLRRRAAFQAHTTNRDSLSHLSPW